MVRPFGAIKTDKGVYRSNMGDKSVTKQNSGSGITGFIASAYRSYRNWQKRGRRQRKWKRTLRNMIDFYSQFIKKGDCCFDIGANMGNRSEAFLALGAKVIAVEPQQPCVVALQERFKGNQDFILVNKALDKKEGQTEFFVSNAHTLGSMSKDWIGYVKDHGMFDGCVWDKKVVVQTTTMDTLIKQYGRPVFCKIDVEGFEFDVLQGLSQPVKMLSMEYTLGIMEPTIKCVERLASLGKVVCNYSEGESLELAMKEWVDAATMVRMLRDFPSSARFGDLYVKFMDA
jgi:FkbM family methyltransferase